MKKKVIQFLFIASVLLTVSASLSAQVYVRVRPSHNVVVRTVQPSAAHVWINEEWEPDGASYRYSGGHWASPPREGAYWKDGHWSHSRRHGDRWVQGNWVHRRFRRH